MNLADLFPDGDYRFHLTLRRTEPREFFGPRDHTGRILAERARWLATEPALYAAALPEAEPLIDEFVGMSAGWKPTGSPSKESASLRGVARLGDLGGRFEPDLLFLSNEADASFRLRGGALCFPTGWALGEKLGQSLEAIHGAVPGLNPAIGTSIQQFLSRLKPGGAFLRDNWGFAATDELNLHPARHVAGPALPISFDKLWLRVEHQALVALPQSRGVLFGIRIALHRMDEVVESPAAPGLRRALESMPRELAVYKRIETVRAEIIARL